MDSEHPDSYDVIKTCLFDDDDEVKKNALVALYNLQGRSVLDEVIREPLYTDILKIEAVSMIDEYETDEDAEFAEKFKEELDG